ncbi:hypothetical protein [Nonomuraea dietziae]|uniref:hypothetical protein n=1 Tax=Nonomuraea dietziae TaxID=65515 RepID=UPI00340DE358
MHQYVAQVEQTRRRRQPIEDLVGERTRTGGQLPQVGLHAGRISQRMRESGRSLLNRA